MNEGQTHDVEVAVREILDSARPRESKKPEPIEPDLEGNKAPRRRHFALGLFLVAVFLVALAALLPTEDRVFWGGSSFLILFVAAWQWDKARREMG